MNSFLKTNKNLASFVFIVLIIIPIFGLNFLIHIIGNILILIFLIPFLLILIAFLSLNSFKTRFNQCKKCGAISFGDNNICFNCGSDLNKFNLKDNELVNNPSETTIEVKAEEIK